MLFRLLLGLSTIATLIYSCQSETSQTDNILSQSIFDYMHNADNPTLTLSGDLSHLFEAGTIKEETGKEHYHDALLSISHGNQIKNIPTRIAKRGVTRKSICDFPPIKLKFKKDTLSTHDLSDFNTYKLVTHCIDSLEELVLSELIVYQLYNHITDNSFRVKRVNMIYKDDVTQTGSKHVAFLIEEDQELAHRLGASLYKDKIKSLDRKQYAEMVIFQYMIGNTDWNLTNGHNMKWIQHSTLPSPTPIPYDFDFCGLVNAPHASPHPNMPIENVRNRMLQWRGKTKNELKEVAAKFVSEKEALYSIITNTEGLSESRKADMIGFLEEFYAEIANEEFYK